MDVFRRDLSNDQLTKHVKVVTPEQQEYVKNSKPWSLAYDKFPSIVLIPESLEELQGIVRILNRHDEIDFATRGRGCGSSSAKDVIISMSAAAWQGIELVDDDGAGSVIVEVGAGTDWGDVDRGVGKLAPGHVVVGARCPYVGVAGSTLTGGFSWLSHEFGLSSDPSNLLDVQTVLPNGEVTWASKHDPELLWALRGGGGNFGIVTKFQFRAHKYSQEPFSGLIFYPPSSLPELSRAVARFTNEQQDPRLAMHVFVVDSNPDLALHGGSSTPQLMALIYDGHGEDHGRTSDGFGWAFDIPGAQEGDGANACREMPLKEVHELQRGGQATHGVGYSWLEAALVGDGPQGFIDDNFLVRAWQWYVMVAQDYPDLAAGSFVLLEIMQTAAFTTGGSPENTAWPHGQKGRRHVLQLSCGSGPLQTRGVADVQGRALKVMSEAPSFISGKDHHPEGDFLPNFLLPNIDTAAVFGENWERLQIVKRKYDPRGRFNGGSLKVPVQ